MRMLMIAAGIVLSVAVLAHAQSAETPAKLPVNPVAKAKVGDWSAFVEKNIAPDRPIEKSAVTWKVTEIDGDDVTAKNFAGPGIRHFDKREMTLEQLFDAPAGSLRNVETGDEKRAFGDREFACTMVSCKIATKDYTAKAAVWLCPDVTGAVVAMVVEYPGAKTKRKLEIAGYGNGDKATWGKTPDELKRSLMAAKGAKAKEP